MVISLDKRPNEQNKNAHYQRRSQDLRGIHGGCNRIGADYFHGLYRNGNAVIKAAQDIEQTECKKQAPWIKPIDQYHTDCQWEQRPQITERSGKF